MEIDRIQEFAIEFVNNHWFDIDKIETEIIKSKDEFIDEIKSNKHSASWVLTEVMTWGCEKNYIESFVVGYNPRMTIKIDDKYFVLNNEDIFEKLEIDSSDIRREFCKINGWNFIEFETGEETQEYALFLERKIFELKIKYVHEVK